MKMRKLLSVIPASALAASIFSGCSLNSQGMPPEPQLNTAFTAECSVTAYIVPPNSDEETEFSFSGTVQRLGTGFWEMDIASPETIAGMSVSAADDTVTIALGELNFDSEAANIPDNAPFMAIFSVLDSAAVCETPLESGADGGWVMTDEKYTIIFDGSGVPVTMAVSQPKITVEFTSFEQKSPVLGESS